jgi:PAS domain S-box-containing protein
MFRKSSVHTHRINLLHHRRNSSLTIPPFSPEKLLPELPPEDTVQFVQDAAALEMASSPQSDTASSVFDPSEDTANDLTLTKTPSFDLKAPPPSISHIDAETLSERLFSESHLNLILCEYKLCASFTSYINTYRPHLAPVFARHQAIQKAKAAIDYANAIAENLPTAKHQSSPDIRATAPDEKFEEQARRAVNELTDDALPGYVTHRLVQVVTDCLVKEIMGNNAPVMTDLMQGLAEVYCMTDPSLPDNPIVYASEEFYRTTQYGPQHAIGRNCRFLQGPKTSLSTVRRITNALTTGTELCETILNYRRDGSPFINLLMMAPLYDDQGRVRYFIGCQIDVTPLIEGGRGLDSFQRLLNQAGADNELEETCKSPSRALHNLGRLLSKDELDMIRQRPDNSSESARSTPAHQPLARIHLGDEEFSERAMWSAARFGPSGRLPGVYQNVSIRSRVSIQRADLRSTFLFDHSHPSG